MTPQDLAAAVADVVQDHVQLVLAPVLADVKSLQTQLAGWDSRWNDVGALRERVAVVESKSASEPRHEPVVPPVTDLGPVQERLAAAEARLTLVGDLRDRVIAVETKAAAPSPPVTVEKTVDLTYVELRLTRLEMQHEMKAAELGPLSVAVTDLTKDVGAMRERLAVVEVRPPQPGPPGELGPPGKDGLNGKDGLAGLSFEGVYQEGQSYEKGQLATWAGSSWHCNNPTTTKPGDGSKDWTLMVKRGRDGKDGLHAPGALPVISIGSRG